MIFGFLFTLTESEEQQKIEDLYYRYRRQMKQLALRFFENEEDAEDAVQNTFIKLIRCSDRFLGLPDQDVVALITVVLKNTCRDMLRKEKKCRHLPLEDADTPIYATNTDFFETLAVEQCYKAIKKLSENEQELLLLKIRCGFSNQSISKLLNLPYMTVAKRQERIRKKLRIFLEEEGITV